MPQRRLLAPPDRPGPSNLPPNADPSMGELTLEALLSPLGLGTNEEDPSMVAPGAVNSFRRAHAAGDMGAMGLMGLISKLKLLGGLSEASPAANMGDEALRTHDLSKLDSRISGLPPKSPYAPLSIEEAAKERALTSLRKPKPAKVTSTPDMGDEHVLGDGDSYFSPDNAPPITGKPNQRTGKGTAVIPPATAKEMSRLMGELIPSWSEGGPAGLKDAFQAVQRRAPRTMGHMQEFNWDRLTTGNKGQQSSIADELMFKQGSQASPDSEHLSKIAVDPQLSSSYPELVNTVAHETAHTGQQLRHGPTFYDKYQQANRQGYSQNPFEIRANKVGANSNLSPEQRDVQRWTSRLRKEFKLDSPAAQGWTAEHRGLVEDMMKNDLEALKRGDYSRGQFSRGK